MRGIYDVKKHHVALHKTLNKEGETFPLTITNEKLLSVNLSKKSLYTHTANTYTILIVLQLCLLRNVIL